MKHIFSNIVLLSLLLNILIVPSVSAQETFSNVKSNINTVQNTNPNLPAAPSGSAGQKGLMGNIIANIFTSAGKIRSDFLDFMDPSTNTINAESIEGLQGLTGSDANKVLKWGSGELSPTNMYEKGGNIGIGTSSPGYNLHVKSSGPYIALEDTDDSRGAISTITSYQDGNMYFDANRNNTSNLGGFVFRTDGAIKNLLAILNNGNVGIGTITPIQKLDIAGNINFTGDLYKNGQPYEAPGKWSDGTGTGAIYYGGGNVGVGISSPVSPLHIGFDNIPISVTNKFGVPGLNNDVIIERFDNNSDWAPLTFIRSRGTQQSIQAVQNGDALGGILNGIRLQNGNYVNNSNVRSIYTGDGTNNKGVIGLGTSGRYDDFFINEIGNIGIGTNNPKRRLQVNDFSLGNTGADILLGGDTGKGEKGILIHYNNLPTHPGYERATIDVRAKDFSLRGVAPNVGGKANTERLFIDMSNGNVGIGTSAPSNLLTLVGSNTTLSGGIFSPEKGLLRIQEGTAKIGIDSNSIIASTNLHVGVANTQPITIGGHNANYRMILNANGNVGIGTNSPSQKLEVGGSMRLTSSAPTIQFNDTTDNNFIVHNNSNILYFMHDANNNMNWDDGDDDRIVMRSPGNGLNLGIGTTDPNAKLDVHGTVEINQGATYDVWIEGSGTTGTAPRNLALLGSKGSDRLHLNFNGEYSGGTQIGGNAEWEFGIGDGLVSGNYGSVQTYGSGKGGWEGYSINGRYNFMSADNNQAGIYNDIDNKWITYFSRNSVYRIYRPDTSGGVAMQVNANGNIGIGTTSPATNLHIQGGSGGDVLYVYNTTDSQYADGVDIRLNRTNPGGNNSFIVLRDKANSVIGTVGGNGAGGVNFNTTSDKRLKSNIIPTHYSLKDLMNIKIKEFNYNSSPEKKSVGVIAQELYEVYPDAVSTGGDNPLESPWTVSYGHLTPIIIKALQDLKQEKDREIEELEQQLYLIQKKLK